MLQARMLGNYAQHLATINNISEDSICTVMDCTKFELYSFYKGRSFLTFEQITNLAELLETTVDDLLIGDEQQYNASVVQCMNPFKDTQNREMILDLIDNYLDIKEMLEDE